MPFAHDSLGPGECCAGPPVAGASLNCWVAATEPSTAAERNRWKKGWSKETGPKRKGVQKAETMAKF